MIVFYLLAAITLAGGGVTLIHRTKKKIVKFLGILLLIAGLIVSLPLLVPYGSLALHTVKCGKLPVVATNFAAGYSYSAPGSKQYWDDINIFTSAYFCSTEEAERGGYHNNPFNE